MKVAITGSIGSGKSICSAYLRVLGYPVFDTDKMVHQYYEPQGPAYQQLIDTFGKDILFEDGHIDRATLASLVFQNKESLQALEDIVYPHLAHEINSYDDGDSIVFYEVPVLFESGFEKYFDKVVMIDIRPEIAIERLLNRNMTIEDIKRRLNNQMSPGEKAKRSDVIISNDGSLEELHQKIDEFIIKLEKENKDGTL